mmetsp:Transcript_9064/g.20936  ORF Transcript_9064/g.20936 Transcript_9064/m.20936 type:complete len:91 (+) Transcript_9064:2-274(+)
MLVFEHPQPALLYLSPACLIALFSVALISGDMKGLMAYTEEDAEEPSKDKPADAKKDVEPAPTEVEPAVEKETAVSPSSEGKLRKRRVAD